MASELEITFKERRAHDCTIILAFVLDTTPSLYPYLYGKTIGSLVPLPRSVFPNRPPAHSYVVGLQRQGINLTDFDSTLYNANPLSLSAHLLGEGYANFGILGALLFEFMFGFLVCYYEVKLNKGHLVALRLLYPVLMFFILTQQRGDIAMMNTAWMLSVCFAVGILLIGSSSYRKTLFLKLRRKNYVSQTENR
ncbi:MAG: hypothetical protein BWK80_60340 [Desulfobacteraceae bacterium IS3]|nr:MAG: hypothetical protein BWK80_60340 [Desulfobacteraceae bacterium IS3]